MGKEWHNRIWASLQPAGADVAVDDDVYQARLVRRLRLAGGVAALGRRGDADALDAEGGGDAGEVQRRVGEVHGDELAAGRPLAQVFEHVELEDAVGAVVGDDPGDGHAVVGGGPERLDGVEGGAISDDGKDGPVGPGQLDADGVGHAGAEAAAGRTVVAARLGHADVTHEVAAGGDRLVEEEGAGGGGGGGLLRHARRRGGRAGPPR